MDSAALYKALLHSHKLFVFLFLAHYVIKLLMLQLGKTEQLAKYSKTTKIPEMILSFGFLVTGVWMLVGSTVTTLQLIKLACVFASIPLAIIGFKKSNKALATLAVLLIVAAYGLAEMNRSKKTGEKVDTTAASSTLEAGKLVYQGSCMSCHGSDGKQGMNGAKDLSVVTLSVDEQKALIRNGRNSMPAYSADQLSDDDLNAVVEYIATFRQ
jgi:mono/diheme cytochrome c family protein